MILLLILLVWETSADVETMQDVFAEVVSLHPKSPREVPKYMLELYWRNQFPNDDVIKSFLPQEEKLSSPDINWFQFVIFNLTSLSSPFITRSELRLDVKEPSPEFQSYYHHRFKPRRINLAPPVKLQLFLVKTNKMIPIDNVLFDWHKEDWISVDITAGIQEIFLKSYKIGDNVLLGVRFKTMTGKVILPDSILKVKSMIGQKNVYTDKIEQLKTMENIADLLYGNKGKTIPMKIRWENLLRKQGIPEKQIHPVVNKPPSVKLRNIFTIREPKYTTRNDIQPKNLTKNNHAKFTRMKRQNSWAIVDSWPENAFTLSGNGNGTIYHYQIDNSSSHISSDSAKVDEITTQHELDITLDPNNNDKSKLLKTSVTNSVHKTSEASIRNNEDKFKPLEDTGKFSAVLMIHMKDASKDRDGEEVQQVVRHLKRTKRKAETITRPPSQQSCARKSLLVNFADLGWDHWIIEPQIFQAYYCSGKCAFPIAKSLFPTSHAYLQSAMFLVSGTPSPCCVPEKQSPLRVLYQESPHVSVLRYFQDMRVESCSCR